jgi:hypothetical protein
VHLGLELELEPVFQAMLANATRLCEAKFGLLNLRDGEVFRCVAVYKVPRQLHAVRLNESSVAGTWQMCEKAKTPEQGASLPGPSFGLNRQGVAGRPPRPKRPMQSFARSRSLSE